MPDLEREIPRMRVQRFGRLGNSSVLAVREAFKIHGSKTLASAQRAFEKNLTKQSHRESLHASVDRPDEEVLSGTLRGGGVREVGSSDDFLDRMLALGNRLAQIISSEREKRKISQATHQELRDVKEEIEALLGEVVKENLVLRERMEEVKEKEEVSERRKPVGGAVVVSGGAPAGGATSVGAAVSGRAEASSDAKDKRRERRKRARKARAERKANGKETEKTDRERPAPVLTGADVGAFKEVRSKRESNKAKEAKKLEELKARKPQRAFIVSVAGEKVEVVKRRLWSEIAAKVGAPMVRGTSTLPRGDILLRPSDGKTYEALRELEASGKFGVREDRPRWPKVLIYDVDRTISKESIPGLISKQNPTLKISEEEAVKGIKPTFLKGPRDDPKAWWVCEVAPELFRKLAGCRVYIGLEYCKVKEYTDVAQCFACQGFGHSAAKCTRKQVCRHCSVEGHKESECKGKDKAPKCVNCGLAFTAGHRGCATRRKAIRSAALRTDFGQSA